MKKKIIILSVILILLLCCNSCTNFKDSQHTDINEVVFSEKDKDFLRNNYYEMSDEVDKDIKDNLEQIKSVYEIVNTYRNENNIQSMKFDPTLTMIATVRAQEIADSGKFSHHRPDKKGYFSSIYKEYGFTEGNVGENLARTYQTAFETVRAWQRSETHNKCMLDSKWTKTGIGIAKLDDNTYIWVQEFASG